MNCPLCIDQTLDVTWRNGIELDICPKCRGIWLDRGEIDRLLAEESSPTPPPPSGPPASAIGRSGADDSGDRDRRDRSNDKRQKKGKKRKSLADRLGDALEEVLDELT